MCVSVNGIIRLIESVCLGPKVIPLSGAHCIWLAGFKKAKQALEILEKLITLTK
jgi:hypothetical protein